MVSKCYQSTNKKIYIAWGIGTEIKSWTKPVLTKLNLTSYNNISDKCMLYNLTSICVLHTPNAGWNLFLYVCARFGSKDEEKWGKNDIFGAYL